MHNTKPKKKDTIIAWESLYIFTDNGIINLGSHFIPQGSLKLQLLKSI